jgi:hypothetical protein
MHIKNLTQHNLWYHKLKTGKCFLIKYAIILSIKMSEIVFMK